jgi:transcriptional regulator with XRE-family HTH domain
MTTRAPDWAALVAALGRQVHAARTLLGWSQEELASWAGTSQGLVSRLERRGGCGGFELASVLKLLHALAAAVPQLEGAASPTARALLACVAELQGPARPPPDPGLAALLRAYQALSPGRQATFRRLVLPLAAVLAEAADDAEHAA